MLPQATSKSKSAKKTYAPFKQRESRMSCTKSPCPFVYRASPPRSSAGRGRDFVIHKGHGFFQDFLHQIARGSFNVNAHERLSAGGTQQHPGFCAFVLDGRVKKEFDAIKVFFAQYLVASQRGGLSAAGACDCGLFHIVGNT